MSRDAAVFVLEDKLAEPAPNRPLALTLGAAAVTLVVIIGVLAGPSVVNCFNSEDGMGMCLRGKMTDAGILPQPPVTEQAVAETPVTDAPATETAAVVAPEADTDVGAPALDVTATPEATDGLIAATFGLLRAEPDGSVVIAGSGTPGSEVEVYSGNDLIGTATVEQSGDWVVVPDAPIAPGGTEITLAEAGKPGRADQSFVVVIDDDKSSEPLVVASTPGAISEVLQGLDRPAETQVAAADPVTPPTPAAPAQPATSPPAQTTTAPATTQPPAIAAPQTAANTPATPQPANPTTAPPVASADTAAPAQPTTLPPATQSATQTPATPPQAPAASVPAEPAASAEPEVSTATAEEPQPQLTPEPEQPETAVTIADPTPATPEPAPAVAAVPPTIDAIEIEGDRTFFAGAGPEGADVRLYVDDTFVADATVTEGRWLVEAGKVLTKPEQRVRVDMLRPGSASVAARAEVNFVVDLPEAEQPVVVADVPPTAPVTRAPPVQPTVEPQTATSANPVATAPKAVEPLDPTPAESPGSSQPTAAPMASSQPEPTAQPEPATATPAQSQPTPEPQPEPAATAPEPTIASAEPTAPEPTAPDATSPAQVPEPTVAEAEPMPAEPDVPTLVAVAVGGPDAARFASGKAIIRRGDNLWTIARRVYGEGIKYTTIYDANTGQIRDPDRIYPGQVFELPN